MGARGTRAIDAAKGRGTSFSLHEYAHDPRTRVPAGGRGYALEAADALGIEPARVFKTIVVEVDTRPTLALVPADHEVDLKAVAAAHRGHRAAIASAAAAERATGYVLGGISPLGTRRALPTVVDVSALEHATVHVSAGRRGLELELEPHDLVALTGAAVAAVARRA